MPECTKHTGDRQIACHDCYSPEELEARIAQLNEFKLPPGPGSGGKSKPRRTDDPAKPKKRSWMDDVLS